MSLLNEERTLDRIRSATQDSPIAVFKTGLIDRRGRHLYDSFFGATISAKSYINSNSSTYLGSFDKSTKKNDVMQILRTK